MPPKQAAKKKGGESLDDILKQMKALDAKKESSAPAASKPSTPSANAKPADANAKPADGAAAAAAPNQQQQQQQPKNKKWPKEQTKPEPTVPIAKLFPSENYPEGEIMQHPLDHNTYRISSKEKKDSEKLFAHEYKLARRGAETHRTVRKWLQSWVKPGMKMIDICEKTENKIRELMENDGIEGGIAFPMGCSLNNCAAHYTPNSGTLSSNNCYYFLQSTANKGVVNLFFIYV